MLFRGIGGNGRQNALMCACFLPTSGDPTLIKVLVLLINNNPTLKKLFIY